MPHARTTIASIGFAFALLAPPPAFAGTALQLPAAGTYYFSGTCAAGCIGQAAGILVAGNDLLSSSFTLQSSGGTGALGPLAFLGSSMPVLSGTPAVLVGDVGAQSFNTAANGNWGFTPNTPVTGTQGSWSTTPVPEPAAAAMLVVGLGALGLTAVRRRARAAR